MSQYYRKIFVTFVLLTFLPPVVYSAGSPVIIYRRVFKSSVPEFIEIKVPEKGDCTYDIRQLDEEPAVQSFLVGDALRAKIFELASQLNDFRDLNLDVKRRIANLGQKTFRWQQGSETHEATFNYTLNVPANQLMQIFEGLARQEQHREILLRRMKYDRLGVNDALMQLETDLNRRAIPEPERLLPVLDEIANDSRILDVARERARSLAERIRNPQQQ